MVFSRAHTRYTCGVVVQSLSRRCDDRQAFKTFLLYYLLNKINNFWHISTKSFVKIREWRKLFVLKSLVWWKVFIISLPTYWYVSYLYYKHFFVVFFYIILYFHSHSLHFHSDFMYILCMCCSIHYCYHVIIYDDPLLRHEQPLRNDQ